MYVSVFCTFLHSCVDSEEIIGVFVIRTIIRGYRMAQLCDDLFIV